MHKSNASVAQSTVSGAADVDALAELHSHLAYIYNKR